MNIKTRTDNYGGYGCEGHSPIGYASEADAQLAYERAVEIASKTPGLIELNVFFDVDPVTKRVWVRDRSKYDEDERLRLTWGPH